MPTNHHHIKTAVSELILEKLLELTLLIESAKAKAPNVEMQNSECINVELPLDAALTLQHAAGRIHTLEQRLEKWIGIAETVAATKTESEAQAIIHQAATETTAT